MIKRVLLASLLLAPSAYAGLRASDTFTEASNTNLASHTPSPTGTSWDESGTDGDLRVNGTNDNVESTNGNQRRAIEQTTIGTPDMVVEADIAITSNAGASNAGILARASSGTGFSDNYACYLEDDTAGAGGSVDFAIAQRIADTNTPVDSNNFNGTIGSVYHVRLMVIGSRISCCVNHTTCIEASDTGITAGNYAGVLALGSGVQTIDNFKAYPYPRGQLVE